MKPEFSNSEITGQKSGPKPTVSLNSPGTMTQSEINARNNSVIAHQARHNPNLNQRATYLGVMANERTPIQNWAQIGLDYGNQAWEPIRNAGHWVWNLGLDLSRQGAGSLPHQDSSRPLSIPHLPEDHIARDPFGLKPPHDFNSRFTDTAARFHNSLNPNNPLELNYPNDQILDAANGALLSSSMSALGSGVAAAAPAVGLGTAATASSTPAATGTGSFIPGILNYGAQALTSAYPRLAALAVPAIGAASQRVIPFVNNLKDFYRDIALPFYAYTAPSSTSLGANLTRAGMGLGAGYQILDSYQHGMREYDITKNPTHALTAGIYNQVANSPVSGFNLPVVGLGLTGDFAADMINQTGTNNELRRRSMEYSDTPEGSLNAKDPLVAQLYSQDPRKNQAAIEELSKLNPYATMASSVFGTLADFKRPLGLPTGTTQERDKKLLESNLQLMEAQAPQLGNSENAATVASTFADSVKSNLVSRGYSPSAITPEVVVEAVDTSAAAYVNNLITQFQKTNPQKINQALSSYNAFKQNLYGSNADDASINIAYYQLMQDLNSLRSDLTPPLPGE